MLFYLPFKLVATILPKIRLFEDYKFHYKSVDRAFKSSIKFCLPSTTFWLQKRCACLLSSDKQFCHRPNRPDKNKYWLIVPWFVTILFKMYYNLLNAFSHF